MEQITENSFNAQSRDEGPPLSAKRREQWPLYSGMISLICALIAAMFGSLLTASSWLVGDNSRGHLLHRAGSVLLILTIPLIILGACCLDVREKRKRRIERG